MHPDLAKLAHRQAGAFSRAQVLRFHSERTLDRRLHDGAWCVVAPGVYRAAATPETPLMRIHAAVLHAGRGARASFFTAASLYTIDANPVDDDIWVTIPHDRRLEERPGLRVVRSRQLSGAHVTTRRGVPTTSASRTVIDLAEQLPRPVIDAVLSDAIRHNLVSLDYLRRLEARLATRRGPHALRAVLADFDPAMESILEREYADIVASAGLPVGEPQHEIFDGKLLVARVDFAYVDLRLAVEVDGYHYHSRSDQVDRDRGRERALAKHKWDVIRFTTTDIREQPATVAADVADRLLARAA